MRAETLIPCPSGTAGRRDAGVVEWRMAAPRRGAAAQTVAIASRRARSLAAAFAEQVDGQGRPIGGPAKRGVDLVIAALALVLSSPVLLAIAVLIRLTTRGPILFSQERVGYGGRLFRCYKFRSMREDAEEFLERHLASNPAAMREWTETQKLKHDPRVTPLGRLLRKSSLDELPQLWNVMRGEMSCIGPRPVVESELARYGEFAADYMKARPGITGLWQVSGRGRVSYRERVEIDRAYARSWSMRLDLWIVPRTIPALFRFDGTS
jgi:exopolysaccharide production protein ExoY